MTPESSSYLSQDSSHSEPERPIQPSPVGGTSGKAKADETAALPLGEANKAARSFSLPTPVVGRPTFTAVSGRLPADLESFFFDRLNFERQSTTAYSERNYRLQPIEDLLARLDNPHHLPVIHVAGTKGKGSVAALIQQALVEAGYRVGLYTSPHVNCLTERFVIDHTPLSFDELADVVDELRPEVGYVDSLANAPPQSARLTFFDVCTAAAFVAFRQKKVDCAVVEVGLGGRLDSTNVVEPVVSVITSISFDHTAQLGNTLEQIATEKAGIIKAEVPVVSGVTDAAARSVILNTANRLGCETWQLNQNMHWTNEVSNGQFTLGLDQREFNTPFDIKFKDSPDWDLSSIDLAMLGKHQRDNSVLAAAALRLMQRSGWKLNDSVIGRAFGRTMVHGRIQVIDQRPLTVLDAAHNPASFTALIETLSSLYRSELTTSKKRLVFAASKDKDYRRLLELAAEYFDEILFCKFAGNPRGVETELLVQVWNEVTAELRQADQQVLPSPKAAFARGISVSKEEDLLVVAGSVFLLGELS